MKSFTYFKSQIYGQWSPTNKIFFWLSIVGLFIGIIFGGKYIITINRNYTITNEKLYSSNQTIINSLDGNDTLNLDNVGSLTHLPGAPIGSSTTEIFRSGGSSVAMALNTISMELPPDENYTKHFTTSKFNPRQIYFFDTEENQSHLISIFDRVFRVTLQKINFTGKDNANASTTLDEFQYEYQFGISEVKK